MDPPYSDSSIGKVVTQLADSKLVGANSVVVITHSPHSPLNATYGPLHLIKERRHGDSCIAIYRKESET